MIQAVFFVSLWVRRFKGELLANAKQCMLTFSSIGIKRAVAPACLDFSTLSPSA
jgi:hypothetical protein